MAPIRTASKSLPHITFFREAPFMPLTQAFAVPHPPLIIPQVGQGREKAIQATIDAYDAVGKAIAQDAPDTVVISSPHAPLYGDYLQISTGEGAYGSFASFGAPQVTASIDYDQEMVSTLCNAAQAAGLAAGPLGCQNPELDHATLIPVYFIQKHWPANKPAPRYVRLSLSGLSPKDHYRLGELVRQAAQELDRSMVFVASGDLSHKLADEGPYGFAPEGPEFDALVCESFESADFLRLLLVSPDFAERAGECGLRSFQIMAGALDATPLDASLMSYEGPYGVGYAVASFTPDGSAGSAPERAFGKDYDTARRAELEDIAAHEDTYCALARLSLESAVRGQGTPSDAAAQAIVAAKDASQASLEALELPGACFVSLKKDGRLRGCIGTLSPVQPNLAAEIMANAISAALHDPRFSPVTPEELPELIYDVDVLSQPEPVSSTLELDCTRYGVIVSTSDGRRGVLLPDLAGVDSVDEQLSIAASKGGIDLSRDRVSIQRFQVVRHV